MKEGQLFASYSGTWRVEACACGGSIAARADEWEEIRAAVSSHNSSLRHSAWAIWQGFRLPVEWPTALVDVSQRASAPPLDGELVGIPLAPGETRQAGSGS